MPDTRDFSPELLAAQIAQTQRHALARAITLAESQRPEDVKTCQALLKGILPLTGKALRLGITGAPGVGKSTFIECFGQFLTTLGKRVAVLSIDPSSPGSKGSILGDKTRMEQLSRNPNAFIRPSPSRNFLGGVAHATREAVLFCEAAGFDVIIIETVGVGQSEFSVKDMCDCFVLLMLAGAGDELQGIKKGIMEMADLVLITKADGDNLKQAGQAQAEFQHALHLLHSGEGWKPQVLTVSSLGEGMGIKEAWALMAKFEQHQKSTQRFEQVRAQQQLIWLEEKLNQQLRANLGNTAAFGQRWAAAVEAVQHGQWTVGEAVGFLINR